MDAKSVIYGETGIERLVQFLRSNGHPVDIATLTEHYIEILRELVITNDRSGDDADES